jgi:hypothetical protein
MLDAVRSEDRPLLAGKVRHLVLHRPQHYKMPWTFSRLRSLAVELSTLHDKSPGALAAFLDRCCCGPMLPLCVLLYHRAYDGGGCNTPSGGNHNHHHLVLPNAPLGLSDVVTLVRHPGIRELSVWPAPMYDMLLTLEHRTALGPAPFRDLTALTMRAGAAGVPDLLSLVPRVAALDLHVIDDRSSPVPKNVLRHVADALLPRPAPARGALR